jgi:protein O-GlcNAc transferase
MKPVKTDLSLLEALELALQHHQAGQLEEAEKVYRQILEQEPHHPDALHLLGIVLYHHGNFELAVGLIRQAIEIRPTESGYYNNLGIILKAQGQLEEAYQCYQKALTFKPDSLDALNHMGITLLEQGHLEEAGRYFEQIVALDPACYQALNNLGNVLKLRGQPQNAYPYFQKALEIKPDYLNALNNLGNLLREARQLEAARQYYQKALDTHPNEMNALNGLANVFMEESRFEEALEYYQKALAVKPDYLGGLKNKAKALFSMGDPEGAIEAYEQALKIKPDDAIRVSIATILPCIYQSQEEIVHWQQRALQKVQALLERPLQIQDPVAEIGIPSFYAAYQGLCNRQLQEQFGRLFAGLSSMQSRDFSGRPKNKKPRIGFISRYLMESHTISKVFWGILERLSPEEFDLVVFTVGSVQTAPIARSCEPIPLVANQLALACQGIEAQNLDILCYLDIGMDPLTSFLSFQRLAPIQCVTWGHPITTGSPAIDYYISSKLFETENSPEHYTEKLVQFDSIPAFFQRPPLEENRYRREDFGISPEEHFYVCPQGFFKFHPDFDPILGGILRQDPQARLVLVNACKNWETLLLKRFEKTLPDVLTQVKIIGRMEFSRYLSFLSLADVMLDTLYFGGGRTTYEALSFGTPVITLPTETMRGRMAYGMYQKMNMMDCVASTPEDYIQKALLLGSDSVYGQTIRGKILAANHVLYEDDSVKGEFEAFFRKVLKQ